MKRMKINLLLLLTTCLFQLEIQGQTLISKNPGAVPNPDALLEVRTQFSNPRGFLMPSTTFGQISGNLFPRIDNTTNTSFNNNGLLIYASDRGRFMYFRDDYNAFTLLNPWTLNADGSILSYNAPGITGFGFGTSSPFSFMDVAGGVTVGSGYAGNNAAPSDGLLVEGKTVIGTSVIDPDPNVMLQVEGNALITNDLAVTGTTTIQNGVTIQGDKNYSYSTPKTYSYSIGIADFVLINPEFSIATMYRNFDFMTILKPADANPAKVNEARLMAPVHLPQGAKVTSLVVGYKDLDVQEMRFALWRSSSTGEKVRLAYLVPENTGSFVRTSSTENILTSAEIVNNFSFNYFILIDLPGINPITHNRDVFSARVEYTVDHVD
ncbi:MAG: hypothetical protein ABJG78_02385 [Cyclobacteriaceae bacterium]